MDWNLILSSCRLVDQVCGPGMRAFAVALIS